MGRKVLTDAAAMEIQRLRSIKDARGLPVYSQLQIASMLGISETTVFRVIHKGGAYMALPGLKDDAEVAASLEKFRRENPDLFADTALDKMKAAVAEVKELPKQAEAMLKELDAGYAP